MRLFNIFVVAAVVSAGQNRNDDIDAGELKRTWTKFYGSKDFRA